MDERLKTMVVRNRIHLVLWLGLLLYLGSADAIHRAMFTRVGEPLPLGHVQPVNSDGTFAFDGLSEVLYEGQQVHLLTGWAFPYDRSLPLSQYRTYLVLARADSRHYYFEAVRQSRPGVAKAYPGLGSDIADAGFQALISKDALAPGAYRIGFLYFDSMMDAIFVETDFFIQRTPNTLRLSEFYPPVKDPIVDFVAGVRVRLGIMPETGMECSIDVVEKRDVEGGAAYLFYGWAIPSGGYAPWAFQRQLVLQQSDSRLLLFDAAPMERDDVAEAFRDMERDLGLSGYLAQVPVDKLPLGTYRVGMLYTSAEYSSLYCRTDRYIVVAQDDARLGY
jgi:hypothetical protein